MIIFWARIIYHIHALTSFTAPHPLNPHQCPTSHWPLVITTTQCTNQWLTWLPTCVLVSSVALLSSKLSQTPHMLGSSQQMNHLPNLSSKAHVLIPWPDRLFHRPRQDLSGVWSGRICAEPFEMWNRLVMTWWHQTLIYSEACMSHYKLRCDLELNKMQIKAKLHSTTSVCHSYATFWKWNSISL